MKKWTLLWAALVPFAMISCEKSGDPEKGGEGVAGAAGKALVKKMTAKGSMTYEYRDDEEWEKEVEELDARLTFSYQDGLLARLSASGSAGYRHDCEDSYSGTVEKHHAESTYKGNGNLAFTHHADAVAATMSGQMEARFKEVYEPDEYEDNEDYSVSGSFTGKYALAMENGAAVSGEGTLAVAQESITLNKMKFEYDNAGQLARVYYENDYEDRVEFKWENGNLVNIGWYYDYDKSVKKNRTGRHCPVRKAKAAKAGSVEWEDFYRVEYTDKENKGNIDIAYICFSALDILSYEQLIGALGFCGRMSRNLPSKIYEMDEIWNEETGDYEETECVFLTFEYSFNGNGTVKQIKLKSPSMEEDGDMNAQLTIKFEY